ncbi:MAG: carbohydrate-binding family 9-like protein [Victivallales bacterium]|nr:carbohydrate-binding family 9-like protein [Victivallales bacterium]
MSYLIKYVKDVKLDSPWDGAVWKQADIVNIDKFCRGSQHPEAKCKLLYNENGIYGLFQVKDRYVRSVSTKFQESVCEDSCVEFFVEPAGGRGYLNFEFNCGGNMLVFLITDATRTQDGFADYRPLTEAEVAGMEQFTTMPPLVDPEITEPVIWRRGFFIPFAVFEKTTGMQTGKLSKQVWRANFYKCGNKTSHPHWASWQPLSAVNFHLPQCFGEIKFA